MINPFSPLGGKDQSMAYQQIPYWYKFLRQIGGVGSEIFGRWGYTPPLPPSWENPGIYPRVEAQTHHWAHLGTGGHMAIP